MPILSCDDESRHYVSLVLMCYLVRHSYNRFQSSHQTYAIVKEDLNLILFGGKLNI